MRCVLYRRVSTDMQAEEGFSLDAQKHRLEAYAESQGWKIVDDYCDNGYSAKNTDRPDMLRLIEDIKKQKFDVILVYRLDRFVRSVLDLHELLQLMDKHDVKFKSATEVFDTTSATGRLFITLIATLAQWERETIAERVHMGQMKKAEQGERNGGPAPFGYEYKDGDLIVNQEEAKWVKFIFERYKSIGSSSITRELNKKKVKTKKGMPWSDFSVRYVLKNPIYTGNVRWNYETFNHGVRKKTGQAIINEISQKEEFKPIITVEEFEEIQQIMKNRQIKAFRSNNFYPFSSVLKCGNCGYGFTGATKKLKSGKEHRYYKCRGNISFGNCTMQVIAEEIIEEEFLKMLDLAKDDMEVSKPEEDGVSLEDLQSMLVELRKRKERAEDLYIDGDITKERYIKRIEAITNEEKEIIKQMDTVGQSASIDTVKEIISNVKNEWQHFSYETKKNAVHALFESITIRLDRPAKPPKQKAVITITDYTLK